MCDQSRGVYDLKCLDCCARLVLSARPSKALAGAMLAAIERVPGAPDRAEIIGCVRGVDRGGPTAVARLR